MGGGSFKRFGLAERELREGQSPWVGREIGVQAPVGLGASGGSGRSPKGVIWRAGRRYKASGWGEGQLQATRGEGLLQEDGKGERRLCEGLSGRKYFALEGFVWRERSGDEEGALHRGYRIGEALLTSLASITAPCLCLNIRC